MVVGNRRLRFLMVVLIVIYCLVVFSLHLYNSPNFLAGNVAAVTSNTNKLNNQFPPPSPLPIPQTIARTSNNSDSVQRDKDENLGVDEVLEKFRKYLKSSLTSKISALRGPRLDKLWDVWNITYSIDPRNMCRSEEFISVMIMVFSSPGNFEARNNIRSSWGRNVTAHTQMRLTFFVGRSRNNEINEKIHQESRVHHDIVQASFDDFYRNLSIKSVLLLRWVSSRCEKSKFVFKVDDDVFINPSNLDTFVEKHKNRTVSIFGRSAHHWHPVRANVSHYFVDENLWTSSIYPDFVTGPAYLITMDAVPKLLEQVSKVPFFFLEDVYITGILAAKAGIPRINSNKFRNVHIPVNPCIYREVISVHLLDPKTMVTAWHFLHHYDQRNETCFTEKCSIKIFSLCLKKEKVPVDFLKTIKGTLSDS